jgi:DNA-binding transcriptional MerR regulator
MNTPEKEFNTTNLNDEEFKRLRDAGFSVKEIENFYAALAYRKEYNSRPDVKEKRKQYSAQRYNRTKMLREILKGGM